VAPIPLSVLVVDDHAVVREALTAYLDAEPGLAVWAAVGSGEEALALLGEGLSPPPPTALLVDVQMPGMDGIELVAEVTARHPGVPCVMLSAHAASTYADRARSAGARGFVEKGRPERLVRALRRAIEAPGWVTDDEGL
jgi:DNA-binding NarL/FixJ family response regulator